MKVVPCEYRPARSMLPNYKIYWVKIWLIIESDGRCHSFLHHSDFIDNLHLAIECNQKVIGKHIDVLCSPDSLSDIYQQILDFESS